MKAKGYLLFIVLCAILFLGTLSITQRKVFPSTESAANRYLDYNYRAENPQRYVLKNGVVLLIKEVHNTRLTSIGLFVRAGLTTEGEFAGSGISHLLEHMIFKGTPARGPGEIDRQIRARGGEMNGFTSSDYTGYTITIPSESTSFAIEVLEDAIFNAALEKREFEKEKQVVLDEVRLNKDDPQRRLTRLLFSAAYAVHPYRFPVIGYEDRLNALTLDDIAAYHDRLYAPENIVIAVVGDVDRDSVLSDVRRLFGRHKRTKANIGAIKREPLQLNTRTYEEYYDTNKTHLAVAFHSVALADKDLYPLDLLAMILGDGEISILNRRLREKERIVYSISASNYTPEYPGLFMVSALLDHKNKQRVLDSISSAIEDIKAGNIDEGLIGASKEKAIARHLFEMERVSAEARRIGIDELTAHDAGFSYRYVKGILGVEKNDIVRAANKYLGKDNMTVVSLSGESAEDIKKAGAISNAENAAIEKYTLPNGLRALIKRNPSLPVVHIGLFLKGGLLAEDEKNNGISNLTVHLLDKGTTKRDKKEIAELLESRGAELSLYSQNNSFGISVKILKNDLDMALRLIRELTSEPLFAQSEIDQLKGEIEAGIGLEDKDIFQVASKELKRLLYRRHPYRLRAKGEISTLERIDRDAIVKFHSRYYVAGNMVLSVFGDIDPAEVKNKVGEVFADIPGGRPKFNEEAEPRQNSIRSKSVRMDREQAICMLGFHAIDIGDKDRYTFDVLTAIISGGGSRLFRSIRDEKGLAYSLGAYQVYGPDAGYFVFYAATTAEAVDAVKAEMVSEISRLRREYIDDEELSFAKENLKGRRRMQREANDSFAMMAALDELYGLGYANYLEYDRRIGAVTKEDVMRIAKKYFDPERYSSVIVLPKGVSVSGGGKR